MKRNLQMILAGCYILFHFLSITVSSYDVNGYYCGPDYLFPTYNQHLYQAIPSPEYSHQDFAYLNSLISPDPLAFTEGTSFTCGLKNYCSYFSAYYGGYQFPYINIAENTMFPTSLAPFSNLKIISLGCMSQLSGTIPNDISKLSNLKVLEISSTNLDGLFPWEGLSNITSLQKLVITERCSIDYKFQGCCQYDQYSDANRCSEVDDESCCSKFENINRVSVMCLSLAPWLIDRNIQAAQNNAVSTQDEKYCLGQQPEEIFTSKRFDGTGKRKYFTGPLFTGQQISKLTNLKHLEIMDAMFTGTLPTELGLLTKLTHLSIRLLSRWDSFKKVTEGISDSNIPTELGLLTNLKTLSLNGDNVPFDLIKRHQLDLTGEVEGDKLNSRFSSKYLIRDGKTIGSYNYVSLARGKNPQAGFSSWSLLQNRNAEYGNFGVCGTSLVTYNKPQDTNTDSFFSYNSLANYLGLVPSVMSDSFPYTRKRIKPFEFDFYVHPFGKADGFTGTIPAQLQQLSELTSLTISHSPKLIGQMPSLNLFSTLENLQILNTGISGNLSTLPNPFHPNMISTIAYNRFKDGCRNKGDPFEARVPFISESGQVRYGVYQYPNQDVQFQSWNMIQRTSINVYSLLGDIKIGTGIPQSFLNVNETLIQRCNPLGYDFKIGAPSQYLIETPPAIKALLKKLEAQFNSNSNYLMDEFPYPNCTEPLFRRKTYRMVANDTSIWPNSTDPCFDSWPGVLCNQQGEIVGLQMSGLFGWNLRGPIPSILGELSSLRYIDFSFNSLTSIPESFQKLTKLERLDLSFNNISVIPEFLVSLSQNFLKDFKRVFYSEQEFYSYSHMAESIRTVFQSDAAAQEYMTTMNISRFFTSLEGNPIKSQPTGCGDLSTDCSILKIGDGKCDAFTFNPDVLKFLGLHDEMKYDYCGRSHFTRTQQISRANIAHPDKCDICDSSVDLGPTLITFVILVAILFFVMILVAILGKKLNAGVVTTFKILIIYMQVMSIMFSMGMTIPSEIVPYMLPFHVLSITLPDINVACNIGENQSLTTLLTLEQAIIILAGAGLFIGVVMWSYLHSFFIFIFKKMGCCGSCCCMTCAQHAEDVTTGEFNERVRDMFFIKAPYLVIIPTVASLTTAFVRAGKYVPQEMGKPTYLDGTALDPTNIAGGGSGVILLLDLSCLVLVVGFFVYLFWMFRKNAKGKLRNPERLAFFLRDQRPEIYYWSYAEMMGRCIIAAFSKLPVSVFAKLSCNILILLLILFLQFRYKPYNIKAINRFFTASLASQIVITIMLFIWFGIENRGGDLVVIAGITLFGAYGLMGVSLFILACSTIAASGKEKAQLEQTSLLSSKSPKESFESGMLNGKNEPQTVLVTTMDSIPIAQEIKVVNSTNY